MRKKNIRNDNKDSESSEEEDIFAPNIPQDVPQTPEWMIDASMRKSSIAPVSNYMETAAQDSLRRNPSIATVSNFTEPAAPDSRRRISRASRNLQLIDDLIEDLMLSCAICKAKIELEDVETHSRQCDATLMANHDSHNIC